MKLSDLVDKMDNIDDDLIVFLEDINDYNSDIILEYGEENDRGIKLSDGKDYYYLLEVFLAKEFINDWKNSLDYIPNKNEIAKRLYEYGINDA
ncbi:MAG: hypothetical protein LBS20_03985 [Prevotella sp.]|jgi:hypothetical protein|nr:hypothetical protein [Prevotella sp.]